MKQQERIYVRRADTGDLDEVAAVWHASASRMDAAPDAMPSLQDLRDRIDAELAAGWELHVAERGGRIVGMLALKRDEAVLDQIFVVPGEQRSGIGTALLAAAKGAMPGGFTLRMAAANERAARFYRAAGLNVSGAGTHPVSGIPVRFYEWKGGARPDL
jgi:GNAT superfamily N-acetyltransferase